MSKASTLRTFAWLVPLAIAALILALRLRAGREADVGPVSADLQQPNGGPPPNTPADAATIVRTVDEARRYWGVPGAAVTIVRGDEVLALIGSGVSELGHDASVTPDTLFPLASCTKAFTTTAMAMLVDEGKMNWDDPVRKHIDYFHLADPLADANVTLRDLVCHRTGLAPNELLWYRSPWKPEEAVRRIGHVKLRKSFRSAFQYQTTMFTAAGLAVAHAAGRPWQEVVQQRIFDPLGMKRSSFTTTAAKASPDHASPHRRNGSFTDVIPWYELTEPEPAGSINTSARDMAQWLRFHLGDGTFESKRLVSAKNLQETHTPQMVIRMEGDARKMNPETVHMDYGMAWVIQDYRGHAMVAHGGIIDGFRTLITLLPADHIGIAILTNLDRTPMNLATSNTLVDVLLGLAPRDWNGYMKKQTDEESAAAQARLREREEQRRRDRTQPSLPLSAYAGHYEDAAYGAATISVENGGLVWRWNNFIAPLLHDHHDDFTADTGLLGYPRVQFKLSEGHVAAMKMLDAFDDVEFRRETTGAP